MLMNSPLLRRGCTAFAAWGGQTADRHLLVGRNFDWEAAPVFDEDRIVIICEPDNGIPFVSLSWAGMVGCVSGMNRAGLGVMVNGAPSNLPDSAATPTCRKWIPKLTGQKCKPGKPGGSNLSSNLIAGSRLSAWIGSSPERTPLAPIHPTLSSFLRYPGYRAVTARFSWKGKRSG